MDLIYEFQFSPSINPKKAHIYPHAMNAGIRLGKSQEWLLDFDMYLLECENDPDDNYCKTLRPEFRDSVVWQRKSYIGGRHVASADYKCVQVIDGDGKKLPAFYEWIKYCHD